MTTPIKQAIVAALSPIVAETYAVELPPNPSFPAIVFDVKTDPEKGWSAGGASAYEQHELSVVLLGYDLEEIETLKPQIRAALEALEGFMDREGEGDSGFEDDPDAYGYFFMVRVRSRTV